MQPVLIGAFGETLMPDTIEFLDAGATQQRPGQNDVIYEQGESQDGVYIICHGGVLLEWRAPNGFVATFRLATGHECFGHRSFCADEPRSTVARAVTPALLLHLPGSLIEEAARRDPEMYRVLAQMLARDTGPKMSKVTRNGRIPARVRLAYVLAHLTERLQASDTEGGTRFAFPIMQKDLSNLLDVSQETVSRILHEFHEEGLLSLEHGPRSLVVTDSGRLHELVAEYV